MSNQNYDLEIKRVSELPEVDDPNGLWIFGSKTNSEQLVTSVKYPFSKLVQFVDNMQLERRFTFQMENREQIVPIGERMTIYKAKTTNVAKLEIGIAGSDKWTEIPTNGLQSDIELDCGDSLINYALRATAINTLQACSVYIMAKVKIEK